MIAIQSAKKIARGILSTSSRVYSTASIPPTTPPTTSTTSTAAKVGAAGAVAASLILGYTQFYNSSPAAPVQNLNAPIALKSDAFQDLKLAKIEPYNHNSAVYTFDLPSPEMRSGLTTASCVLFKAAIGEDGKNVIRPYTPISRPGDVADMKFLIKDYPNGVMSSHIANMKTGETLSIKGPIEKIQWQPNMFTDMTFIAGGTGITPHFQIIQEALSNPADKTKMTLLYGSLSEKDILLKEQFDKWAKQHADRFNVIYVLDKAPENWSGESGYMTQSMLEKYMPPASLGEKTKVFVCGPPPLYNAISGGKGPKGVQGELSGVLAKMGFTKEQVYKF